MCTVEDAGQSKLLLKDANKYRTEPSLSILFQRDGLIFTGHRLSIEITLSKLTLVGVSGKVVERNAV